MSNQQPEGRGILAFLYGKEDSEMSNPNVGNKPRNMSCFCLMICFAMILGAYPVLASGTAAITGKITNLYNLVLGIIKAAGAIVLAWGVFEFAAGYQSHDSSQQTQSLKKVISGILMCGASTIISLVK